MLTQKKCYSKNAERTSSQFTPDNQVPKEFKVLNKDFLNSGYDRGHLAAAANHTQDQDSMDDTFLLTNISPQASLMPSYHSFIYIVSLYCQCDSVLCITIYFRFIFRIIFCQCIHARNLVLKNGGAFHNSELFQL